MSSAVDLKPRTEGSGKQVGFVSRRMQGYRWISIAGGLVIAVLVYFPIIFVLSNSLKTGQNISNGVFSLFNQFYYQNYITAWSGIDQSLLNTIIVAAASIVLAVAAAALAAYSFSQLKFRGKEIVFLAYVGLLLVPWTLTLIPLFLTIQKLHLFNTWWALILPYAASSQPLLVLIFRGFFDQFPQELLESARVDGASEAKVLLRIIVPLTKPILLTGAILVTINVWGDYLWPTIVIQNPHSTTISAGVHLFVSSFGLSSAGGSVFAAYVIATVPAFILVGFTMRYFVSGLTEGALKL